MAFLISPKVESWHWRFLLRWISIVEKGKSRKENVNKNEDEKNGANEGDEMESKRAIKQRGRQRRDEELEMMKGQKGDKTQAYKWEKRMIVVIARYKRFAINI